MALILTSAHDAKRAALPPGVTSRCRVERSQKRQRFFPLYICIFIQQNWPYVIGITPTPVFVPGEPQGWGSLAGCRLWGRTEVDTTEATQQQRHWHHMATPS